MREHVKVALSGDGGDEGFGGYNYFWQIARIARLQNFPALAWHAGALMMPPLVRLGLLPGRFTQRVRELTRADDTSIIQGLFSWIREEGHKRLCRDTDLLPIRRFFESQWQYHLPSRASRVERLSAHATEVGTRLTMANDFLFKVDTASMKESLEIRVPMLDEDLFAFGLSIPHELKVKSQSCKRVLRTLAERWLPQEVARKPKWGFGVPVDSWVDTEFKARLRQVLLGTESRLPDFFLRTVYRPVVEAFCEDRPFPGMSRQVLYQQAIMCLTLQMHLTSNFNETESKYRRFRRIEQYV